MSSILNSNLYSTKNNYTQRISMSRVHLSLLVTSLLAVNLTAQPTDLTKVTIITASKKNQSLKNVTANVSVITADDIEERGYTTVSQALSSMVGFATNSNGGLGKSTSILLRGFDSKRVLVLMDGIRYNDITSPSGAQFENILTENVARIEVIKGAQSGIWGADASAGVINIITKKATKDGFTASLNGEYGSYNTQKYALNTTFKKDTFDVTANLQRLSSDGFSAKVPADKDVSDFEDDAYTNNTLDFKVGYNITGGDRLEAFYNIIDADNDFDGFNIDPVKAANDTNSSSESKEQFYGVNYTKNSFWGHAKLYAHKSKFERYYPNGFTKHYDGSIDEIGLHGGTRYRYFKGDINAGFDYKKFTQENEIAKDYNNKGFFLSNTNTFNGFFGGKTVVNEALRYDDYNSFDNKLTYKIGVKHFHKYIDGLWTSANYATAYNVPTLYQLYSFYGNANLNPETTKSIDITANYKGFGITYFYNTIEDLIDYDFSTSKYGNLLGKNRLSGIEVSYANHIQAIDTQYSFNYTYVKTEDKQGDELLRRPKHSANFTMDYYGLANTHLGTKLQYVGKRFDEDFSTFPSKKINLPSYTLVDIIGDYNVTPQFNIYARVENLLDKKYEQVLSYATSERAFYVGLRYKF